MPDLDDDFLDGCDLDFTEDPDDEETQALRPLFPKGTDDAHLEPEWRALFDHDPKLRELAPLTAQALTAAGSYSGSGYDTGIAARLRAAGLTVVEVNGWQTRGSSSFSPKGSVDHHTAGARNGNAPSLGTCINGRSDLPGPLCNVLIGRDGTCYVIAAGRANHAGKGGWQGLSGNSTVYGIERENVGTTAEPWTPLQTSTAARAHVALMAWKGDYNGSTTMEHKEWALGRKNDAHTITGDQMRAEIRKVQSGNPTTEEEDMTQAITYPGATAIWLSDGTTKFTLGAWQELVDAANNGMIRKDGNGNPVVGVYSKVFVDRLPETTVILAGIDKAASKSQVTVSDAQLQAFAKSVVKELSDAVAAGVK